MSFSPLRSFIAAVLLAALAWWSPNAYAQPVETRHVHDVVSARGLAVPPLPSDYVTVHRGALTISYPRSLEPVLRGALERAESDLRGVSAPLGIAPPNLEVRLVPDHPTMVALAPREAPPPSYAAGVAYPGSGLALVAARAPRSFEAVDVRRVLRHELSHLVLGAATGDAPVPRWLSEGLAVEQSGEHSFDRFQNLAVASFTRGIVPLARLDENFNGASERVDLAYAQSADFVGWLIRTERPERFAVLLGHLRAGTAFDRAVSDTYGATLSRLEDDWRKELDGRFALAPVWAGTGLAWVIGVGLLIASALRRRRKSKVTLDRWDREEKRRDEALRMMVVTPGLRVIEGGLSKPADDQGPMRGAVGR